MGPISPLNHIVAFIQPARLDAVVDSLRALPHFPGLSVSEGRGFGAPAPDARPAGAEAPRPQLEVNVRIDIFCRPSELVAIIETIRRVANSGKAGDGKIFASPAMLAYRIRTGEWGEGALLPAAARERSFE